MTMSWLPFSPCLSLTLVGQTVAGELANSSMPYPPLPEGISSFGATVAGDAIYVFGGHMGRVLGK